MKKKYSRYKELMSVPRYKALFKLGGWIVFFIIFFVLVAVSRQIPINDYKPKEENTKITYTKMKNNLLNNLNVKYTIGDYLIEGIISNNVLTGTIENNSSLIKFKYDGINFYTLKKEEEIISNDLYIDLNKNYFLPKYIIDLLNENDSLLHQSADEKVYSYLINDVSLSVYVNEKAIIKIIILDNNITYLLEYN